MQHNYILSYCLIICSEEQHKAHIRAIWRQISRTYIWAWKLPSKKKTWYDWTASCWRQRHCRASHRPGLFAQSRCHIPEYFSLHNEPSDKTLVSYVLHWRPTVGRSNRVPNSVVTICTTSLTFNNLTFCPHSCIYVFCVDLRTNSHYFPTQH